MPAVYHAAPRYGFRRSPLTLQRLVADEGHTLLRVFLEYEVEGSTQSLRLLPTDGFKGEESFSLYAVKVPVAHLCGGHFSYRFSGEGAYTRTYKVPLEDAREELELRGEEAVPALLPLCTFERYYLSQGELRLRFLTFPWKIQRVRVFVREKGVWRDHDARLSENGEWECVLPTTLLNVLGGKLFYFVEAIGHNGGALLGNEREALSIRLVADAGPTLSEIRPADGETVVENPPEIRVAFADASGVDLRASSVYLDGRAVGENAIWMANGMSFRPEKPLDDGEHILEIDLRDTLGNRTYRRVPFRAVKKTGEGKRPRSAVQAAGLLASAIVALKKIFTDKD